jgi:hypothetical protein
MSDVGRNDDNEDFANDGVPDPLQVAIRLHESRRWLGSGEPPWDELPDDVKSVAVALMVAIISWLIREGTIRP